MKRVLLFLLLFPFLPLNGQEVPVHIRNEGDYEFLSRLNALHLANAELVFRPVSTSTMLEAIKGVDHDSLKTFGLWEEWEMYSGTLSFWDQAAKAKRYTSFLDCSCETPLHLMSSDLFSYRDSSFRFRFNPLFSYEFYSNDKGSEYWRRSGLAFEASLGKHWGFWGSLADNYESVRFSEDHYLTQRPGANYKLSDQAGEYSETRGGISYAWKSGHIMMAKGNVQWGSGYHGTSIFSGRTPSYPFLKLNLKPVKWLEFNYFHGWLVSEVIDSNRTGWYTNAYGNERREYFYDKYIAANMFTFRPWKRLNISFGNSIIYSDDHPKFAYFIPFLFWKSVDHTLTGAGSSRLGQNSQMFFDISSFQIRHLHLYTSVFVDEVSFRRFWDENEHSNFFGMKIGAALYDLPIPAFRAIMEYTRSHPLAYRHNTPLTTFESNRYNLGHYLTDNADEFYASLRWSPLPLGYIQLSYTGIRKGPDYTALGGARLGLPFMEETNWTYSSAEVLLKYTLSYHLSLRASLRFGNSEGEAESTYLPEFYRGKTTTGSIGLHWNY